MHSLSISRLAVKCLLAVVCHKWFPVAGYKWLAVIALKCSKTAVVLATQLGCGGRGLLHMYLCAMGPYLRAYI